MRYLSVCSGIEAATVAWRPLGWKAVAFSEIEPFPSAVLAHHYPSVPNLGDMTKFKEWPDANVDVLVGGTPCQSFSIAGLRKGLADPRGNLMLTYLAIADRYRPRWLVWENVPGVLSSNKGRDFGTFLGGLAELGYGFAYRVLDAQYVRVESHTRAVPQRRRRVFVVGHFGDWRRAAAVLFERESLRGHSAPRRAAREGAAARAARSVVIRATGRGTPLGPIHCRDVAGALTSNYGKQPDSSDTALGPNLITFDTTQITSAANYSNPKPGDACHPLAAGAHAPAFAFGWQNSASQGDGVSEDICATLDKSKTPAVAYDMRGREGGAQFEGPHDTANIRASSGGSSRSYVSESAVRRLTPLECERLQGFPDGYTRVPYRNELAKDGPRYKAIGNSMAVNCMRWIGERIGAVDGLPLAGSEREAA